MATYLVDTIRLLKRNPEAMLNALVGAYEKDFGTYARGNNKTPLESAAKLLTTGKMDKAIKLALADGHTAGGLVDGYIGSVSGKWADQSDTVQAPFLEAIERATEAFRLTLVNSELFNEKPELTKEEKQKAKSEREEKKSKETAEQKAAILNAAVVAGEVVRAEDVHPVPDTFEMVTIIYNKTIAGLLTSKDEDLLFNGLVSRMDLSLLRMVQTRIANEIAAKATTKATTKAVTKATTKATTKAVTKATTKAVTSEAVTSEAVTSEAVA